jgi:hypothetical protein
VLSRGPAPRRAEVLPRKDATSLRFIRFTLAALVIVGLLTMFSASAVLAADITVNSLSDAFADDGFCTLGEAIGGANIDTALWPSVGECPAGSGVDHITFSVSGTITQTSTNWAIGSELSIDGAGAITINGNNAHGVLRVGGGGTVILSGLTITGGAISDGAGIHSDFVNLIVTDSTISGNTTTGVGGGFLNEGTLTVINSTISGNTAGGMGGGIFNRGTLTVINSTISGNTAATRGGGIAAPVIGNETLLNTVVAGNAAPTGPEVDGFAETTTTSLIGVPAGMTLADILDPAGLADNGGGTQTIALAQVAGNPAIGTATAATCAAAPVNGLDQRGLTRLGACDIGAYEHQQPTCDLAVAAEGGDFVDDTLNVLVGDTTTVAGFDFPPDAEVTLERVSSGGDTSLGTDLTDANGLFASEIVWGIGDKGTWNLSAHPTADDSCSDTLVVVVAAAGASTAPTPTATPPAAELPDTATGNGHESGATMAMLAAMALASAATWVARRSGIVASTPPE